MPCTFSAPLEYVTCFPSAAKAATAANVKTILTISFMRPPSRRGSPRFTRGKRRLEIEFNNRQITVPTPCTAYPAWDSNDMGQSRGNQSDDTWPRHLSSRAALCRAVYIDMRLSALRREWPRPRFVPILFRESLGARKAASSRQWL